MYHMFVYAVICVTTDLTMKKRAKILNGRKNTFLTTIKVCLDLQPNQAQ